MSNYPATSAIILAGGTSVRLGQDKRRLRLWGEEGPTLLAHTVAIASALCREVVVVLNDPDEWRQLPALLVADSYPGAGPLGGLASGLKAMTYASALTLSSDLPLLNQQLLLAMLGWSRDYDALIPRRSEKLPGMASLPRNRRGLEPLHAIYSHRCLPLIQTRLAAGQHQLTSFLDDARVVELPPEVWRPFDQQGLSFMNVNTPDQLAEVYQIISRPF